jgi:tetratricopeptide (TPR) repeat protein
MPFLIEDAQKNFKAGNIKQAIYIYKGLIKNDPNNSLVHEGLAQCYFKLSKLQMATDEVLNAIQLEPDLAQAHVTLAFIDYRKNRYEDCEKEAIVAIDLDPNNAMAYSLISLMEEHKGDYQKGILAIQKAIHINPKNYVFYVSLGRLEGEQGNLQEGLKDLLEADQLEPNNWAVFFHLGIIYLLMKEKYLSVNNLGKAFFLHPNFIITIDLIRAIENAIKPFNIILGAIVALSPLYISENFSLLILILFSGLNLLNGITNSSYVKKDWKPFIWRALFNLVVIIIWCYVTNI